MADEFVLVPAREARAVQVPTGGSFRVVEVEGGQVADLFVFVAGDVGEYASAEHTRIWVNRLFPRVGEAFVTNRRRPILWFEADDSPGVHDMLCAACDPTRYRLLGVEGWHPSCQENLQRVMAGLGHDRIEVPQPINLFMAVRVEPDGSFTWGPSPAGAGELARDAAPGVRRGRPARRARLRRGGVCVPAGPQRDQPLPANTHRHPAPRLPAS